MPVPFKRQPWRFYGGLGKLSTPTFPTALVGSNGTGQTAALASYTPSPYSLQAVCIHSRASVTLAASTFNFPGNLDWQVISDPVTGSHDLGSGTRARQIVYGAIVGASPTAIAPSATNAGACRQGVQLLQVIGARVLPTNWVTSAASTTGDPTTTLPQAADPLSTLLAFFGGANASTFTCDPPTGFTELEDVFDANASMQTESSYDELAGATVNAWSTTGAAATFATVIEVRQP